MVLLWLVVALMAVPVTVALLILGMRWVTVHAVRGETVPRLLLVAGLLMGVALVMRQAGYFRSGEEKAVAFVEKLGGKVERSGTLPGEPVTGVYLYGTEVTDEGMRELAPLRHLRRLTLGRKVSDAGLKELAPLTTLTQLSLSRTKVTDAGMRGLAPLTSLTHLSLEDTQVTDAGLRELAPLKNLTSLDLRGIPITDQTLAVFREINLLHALSVATTENAWRPATPEAITTLNLGGTKVTDSGLRELAGLHNLASLRLNSCKVTDAGVRELAGLKNLASLDLSGCEVTDSGLKELVHLQNLTSLDLSHTLVTGAGLKELASLQNLTTLRLRRIPVTDAGLRELAPLRKLTTLSLTTKTDQMLAVLREIGLLHALTEKSAHGSRAAQPEEITLDLSGSKVTDLGLKELANLKQLTTLDLSRTLVTQAGVRELQMALPKCEIIK